MKKLTVSLHFLKIYIHSDHLEKNFFHLAPKTPLDLQNENDVIRKPLKYGFFGVLMFYVQGKTVLEAE